MAKIRNPFIVKTGGGTGQVDLFPYITNATNLFSQQTDPKLPNKVTLNLTSAKTIGSLVSYAQFEGTNPEMTIYFTEKCTNMGSMLQAASTLKNVYLYGSTKNVTNFMYWGYICSANIYGDPIDLTSATGNNNMVNFFGYTYANIKHVLFKANTRSTNSTMDEGLFELDTESAISYGNSLKDAGGVTKNCYCSRLSNLTTIVGTVSQVTDDTGTYDFFTEDANGTVTLSDFITQYKGWTIV